MPYDEAIANTKIDELNQKNRDLRVLERETNQVINSLRQLLDVEEQDKEADGSPKFDNDGRAVIIKVMPLDEDTMEKLTTARRTTVYDKMIVAADTTLAKTA